MKLAKVKVEYTCGLTLIDRVTIDLESGDVYLPPRLTGLLDLMQKIECCPAFSLEHRGAVVPVQARSDGTFTADLSARPAPGMRGLLRELAYPTKEQRHQQGRYIHTLSAASAGGAAAAFHAAVAQGWQGLFLPIALLVWAVILWYAGLMCFDGE